ncbi:MAG TPA: hypothetical protein PLU53_11020 [Bacteroidia bacterium]|nr:hypothetical protein [Bacteroidia bacterium]
MSHYLPVGSLDEIFLKIWNETVFHLTTALPVLRSPAKCGIALPGVRLPGDVLFLQVKVHVKKYLIDNSANV